MLVAQGRAVRVHSESESTPSPSPLRVRVVLASASASASAGTGGAIRRMVKDLGHVTASIMISRNPISRDWQH